MKPKNLKEFKALIKRYETITLEEIKKVGNIYCAANELTGFGDPDTCPLCRVRCCNCVYTYGCTDRENKKTYMKIVYAETPTKLRNAFRARAKHIKTLLNSKS